jgi:hypothetical protein
MSTSAPARSKRKDMLATDGIEMNVRMSNMTEILKKKLFLR